MQTLDTSSMEAALLAAANAADSGEEVDIDFSALEDGNRTPPTEAKPEAKAPEINKPTSKPESAPEKDANPEQPELSKYEKAKQRQAETWQKLNAEREAIKAERAQIQADREAWDRQQRENATRQPAPQLKDDKGFSASDYREGAKGFRADGRHDLADAAENAAKALDQQQQQAEQDHARTAFQGDWEKGMNHQLSLNADLRNIEHPLSKATMAILGEHKEFCSMPDGFAKAVRIAELQLKADAHPGLQAQVDQLTKELARLNKLTSPMGSTNPQTPSSKKSFDDMSMSEQEAELKRMTAEADRLN